MKIGILTYHRPHHYGAILQAVATREMLQRMGHDVHYVDYWPDYHARLFRLFSVDRFKKERLHYLRTFVETFCNNCRRKRNFNHFISCYIAPFCLPCDDATVHYDAVIYGSDQIWRKQKALDGFNPVYFAQNTLHADRHIAYAASMGVLQTDSEHVRQLQTMLPAFHRLGVREEDLQNFLCDIGIQSTLTLDPTLMLTAQEWDGILKPEPIVKTGYVVYYNILKGSFDRDAIVKFASERGLRVIEIANRAQRSRRNVFSTLDPSDFVSLIKFSDAVFTSSFHGLAFSLIYGKNVYTSFPYNSGRASSLLRLLNMENRLLKPMIGEIPESDTDYKRVRQLIQEQQEKSIRFLAESLNDKGVGHETV